MKNRVPNDEINVLKANLSYGGYAIKDETEASDELDDLLAYCYIEGINNVNDTFNADVKADLDRFIELTDTKYEGNTYHQELAQAIKDNDGTRIDRIVETQAHRFYNAGAFDAALKSGKVSTKIWRTEEDDKVRDTHYYLNGTEKALSDKFYTYDGDSALMPNDFNFAHNNINCRCWLDFK